MIVKKLKKSLKYGKIRMFIGLFLFALFFVNTTTAYAENKSLIVDGDTITFQYTGNEETINIERTGLYTIKLFGAQGKTNIYEGGKGGSLEVTVELKRGDVLNFIVGGQDGFNGGGTGTNANGGGATDVRLNGKELSDRILVAGGGGGATAGKNGGDGGTETSNTTTLGIGQSTTAENSGGGGGGYYGGSYGSNHVHSPGAGCYANCTIKYGGCRNCHNAGIGNDSHGNPYQTGVRDFSHEDCGRGKGTTGEIIHTFYTHMGNETQTHQYVKCSKTSSTSCGGSNYSNTSLVTTTSSLSGQNTGNGYATILLSKSYFNIDNEPINTAVFESMDALFHCYSSVSSVAGKYVWQVFYNHEYRDIATLSYNDPAVKRVNLYGTDYEVGFDENMVSYLKIKNTSQDKNNNAIYRCIVYDDVKGTNNLISNDVTLTVLTNAVTKMDAVYMYDELEVNSDIKIQDIFAICSYQAGGTDVLRNFSGLKILSIDDNNGNKHTFDSPVTSVKAYKTGNLTVNMVFSNEISYMQDNNTIVETRTYYPSFKIKVVDTTKPIIKNVDTSLDAYGNYYVPGNDPFLQIRANVTAIDNYCETVISEPNSEGSDNPVKVDTGKLTYSFYLMNLGTGQWQGISDQFREGNFYDVLFSYGNGKYRVFAKDSHGNISEPYDFSVTGWDNVSPTISINLTSKPGYSKYADIFADVSDGVLGRYNIGQLSTDGAYYLEMVDNNTNLKQSSSEISDWTFENTFHLLKNGLYRVYARDNFGNMSSNTININNIDTVSPTVSYNISSCGDGKKVLVTLKATDSNYIDTNSAVSGLKKENNIYDCFNYSSNVQLEEVKEDGDFVRTYFYAEVSEKRENYVFTTSDNAGNSTSNLISCEEILETIRKGTDGEYTIVKGFTCENTDYTTTFPESTANGVIITPEVETGTNLPAGAYSWDYDNYFGSNEGYWDKKNGTWSSSPNKTVKENGTYTVYVKQADGFICRKSITITNIDTKKPTVTAFLNDQTLTIIVEDADSGLNKVIVDGGTLSNIHEFTYDGKNSVKEMITLTVNGSYAIYAIDTAGNRSDTYSKVVSSISELSKNFYTVNFTTYSGAIIESQYIREGEDAIPPKSVKREGYTFCGWDKSYTNIQSDMEINAVFLQDEKSDKTNEDAKPEIKYTVIFCNWDGSVLKSQAVAKGKDATPPSNPTRAGYVFSGWDKSYANVMGDVTTTALFIVSNDTTLNKTSDTTPKTDSTLEGNGQGGAGSSSSSIKKEIKEEVIEPELKYIELSEFADEATILSVSAYDSNTAVKKEELADAEYIKSILEEDVETAENTEEMAIEGARRFGVKQIGAIVFLVLTGGAVVFYFLNKKYYWVDLPF